MVNEKVFDNLMPGDMVTLGYFEGDNKPHVENVIICNIFADRICVNSDKEKVIQKEDIINIIKKDVKPKEKFNARS